MNNTIKPPRLKPGDTVGDCLACWPHFFSFTNNWLSRAQAAIEGLGLKVQIANNALQQREHLNPAPQLRVDDLHDLFAAPDIKAIFCLSGGSGTNALLPLLDWDLIAPFPQNLDGIQREYGPVTWYLHPSQYGHFPRANPTQRSQRISRNP